MIRSLARTLPERFTVLLIALFAASIVRLWLMPLPSSLWVDELSPPSCYASRTTILSP
jgi:hypothetical protein